jgi:magnesium chelatase subunit D
MSLPFSAVVGQDDAKLALLLCSVDRRIGGVLLRGDKGSAKSTLARALAALLPGHAPFVELPIGATEDRVVGTLDISEALTGGRKRFDPGLLHAADGGVLYVDEVNLLPDHLVDVLLDVAASGVNRIEREGISNTHPSRFVLVGSMNPEEGELRPQLLDRFGLAVEVRTAPEIAERAAAVRRRLHFDSAPAEVAAAFAADESDLRSRLVSAHPALIPDEIVDAVSGLCAAVGAQGLRADIAICRAAAALAGWEGRAEAGAEEVRRVASMALAHRARRDPFDPVGIDAQSFQEALDATLGGPGRDSPPAEPAETRAAPLPPTRPRVAPDPPAGRRGSAEGARGRLIGDRPPDGPVASVAVAATVRQAARRRLEGRPAPEAPLVGPADLREAVRQQRTANLVVLVVDASGSMGAAGRMEAAKGAAVALLRDAYQRRDLVALVAFRDEGAEVLLRPTGSVEVARARLGSLPTGGRTPLAAGIRAGLEVASGAAQTGRHAPVLVVITDGRATAGPAGQDPLEAARAAARAVAGNGVSAVVLDVEGLDGGPRLGLGGDLAAAMGARHLPVSDLTAQVVQDAVAQATPDRRR